MKANMDDYKQEIHRIVDQITSLPRIIRIYSYVRKTSLIESEEKEEEN